MARLRSVRSILLTLIVGAMLGFVVPTFVDELRQDVQVVVDTGETPAARRFIVALLSNDQATLSQVSLQPSDAIEAARLRATGNTVTSLTHLGSTIADGLHLHSYAAEFTAPDGTTVLRGFRVVSVGRFAILADPPEPVPS